MKKILAVDDSESAQVFTGTTASPPETEFVLTDRIEDSDAEIAAVSNEKVAIGANHNLHGI